MIASSQTEFAGFPASSAGPVAVAGLREFLALSAEHGGLVPQAALASTLNLSTQRISQLVAAGRFVVHRVFGQNYVTADSLEAFILLERKTGRPIKVPSVGRMVEGVRASVRARRKGSEIS